MHTWKVLGLGADTPSRPIRRRRRPTLEALEPRTLLALGLFIENFSDDLDPTRHGFDSSDTDPNTTSPDGFIIPHQVSSRAFIDENTVLSNSGDVPSPPDSLLLPRPGESYLVDFAATRGQPGGLAAGEEVASVAVRYSGIGEITFIGAHGVKTVLADSEAFAFWRSITVTGNSPSDSGGELGAIQQLAIRAVEGMFVDDVAVLVLQEGFSNNAPVANPDSVTTLPATPVKIDALGNDGDADGDPISLVSFDRSSQEAGTVEFQDGKFTYAPAPGFHGLDTFHYVISDGRIAAAPSHGGVQVLVDTRPRLPSRSAPPTGHGFVHVRRGGSLAGLQRCRRRPADDRVHRHAVLRLAERTPDDSSPMSRTPDGLSPTATSFSSGSATGS